MDIRSGVTLWELNDAAWRWPAMAPRPGRCDVAIIGAGVTGAFLAERLTREGHSVVVIDRRGAQRGATAASTALVLWETDQPLVLLEQRIGFEAAASVFRRGYEAVRGIRALGRALGAQCDWRDQESLYLAGDMLDGAALRDEAAIRACAGLESHWCDEAELYARADIVAAAALRAPGAAILNPVALTRALLAAAIGRGAVLCEGVGAFSYALDAAEVAVRLDDGGVLRAGSLVLATGYEMPPMVRGAGHTINSTWVLATAVTQAWRAPAVVWEASESYAYMRGAGGRVLIGGADEENISAAARDALMARKIDELRAKLAALAPAMADAPIELAWSGFFGVTRDSLPLIGAVPGAPRAYAAYGYGGNGVTFSAIAADVIARMLAGERDRDEAIFALDRFA
ncbi:MAG: FAD-binding oxidoreductase [Caulobacterales bacterium]|jgi:glycine/D-amino acid oxidase-like deaminating enzyme|nr:FAD-binding oxidoreductase [Caulobacterales bacterium]